MSFAVIALHKGHPAMVVKPPSECRQWMLHDFFEGGLEKSTDVITCQRTNDSISSTSTEIFRPGGLATTIDIFPANGNGKLMSQEPWRKDLVTKELRSVPHTWLACGLNFQMKGFEVHNSRAYWARGVFGLVG
jgi:hypothetical protein